MTEGPIAERFPRSHILASRYRIIRLVGQGGMAGVYLAEDTKLKTEVAVKVLFEHFRSHRVVCARFRQEVIAARKIVHPAIIRVHDLHEDAEALLFSMEYFEGKDGKYLLRDRGRFEFPEAVEVVTQVCDGLERAHAEGVVHGDVKPHNVLIAEDGTVKIVDFGMARVNTLAGITAHSMVLGTPEYAAPELFTDRFMDARADVYSTGVLLYELVTGKLPFRGKTPYEVIHLKTQSAPPSPRQHLESIPGWLAAVIEKAMASNPEDRFQSVRELRAALTEERTDLLPMVAADGATCSHCNTRLIEGFPFCFSCGRDSAFVRQTPGGDHLVMVKRRLGLGMRFGRGAHDELTFDQKFHMVERVWKATGTFNEDTSRLDRRMRYSPFVVVDRLSKEDADKLAADLLSRSIPSKVIKDNRLALFRFFINQPGAIAAVPLLGLLAFTIGGTVAGGSTPIGAVALLVASVGAPLALAIWWQKIRMRPLSDLARGTSLWSRLFGGRKKALPDSDPIVRQDKDRAALGWLMPIAKQARARISGEGLKRTLARLFGRAAELERALCRVDWLS